MKTLWKMLGWNVFDPSLTSPILASSIITCLDQGLSAEVQAAKPIRNNTVDVKDGNNGLRSWVVARYIRSEILRISPHFLHNVMRAGYQRKERITTLLFTGRGTAS